MAVSLKSVAEGFVVALLTTYFLSRVYQSVLKMSKKNIGTSERKANNKTASFPSMTLCLVPEGDEDIYSDIINPNDVFTAFYYATLEGKSRFEMSSIKILTV